MDSINLTPLTDEQVDALGVSAATDYDHHQVTSILPRRLLQLLAEVRIARIEREQHRSVIAAAVKLAAHWRDQDGVNAAIIDELADAVDAFITTGGKS